MLVNMIAKTPDSLPTKAKAAHVIVLGNEKGGSGKSTIAMHLAVALLKAGWRVATIDTDSRQQSLTHYVENRRRTSAILERPLELPSHFAVPLADGDRLRDVEDREFRAFAEVIGRAGREADFVIIDTPGNDTNLSRIGHASADTLVTPMNDSFLDFDLLAKLDPDSLEIKSPSLYAEFVWDCRKRRLIASRANLDWIVMRNRVSSTEARNKRKVATAVERVSSRIGCRIAAGFSERVIFRELFPLGLTMLDLPLPGLAMPLTMSHIAARQEVRELLATLRLPGVEKASGAQ